MKVKDCKGCRHCFRGTWVQHYKPANYHEIAFTHAYHACSKHQKRCSEIKYCHDFDNGDEGTDAYWEHIDIRA